MGLFNKKLCAEEILKLIAELSEEDREAIMSMLAGKKSPEAIPAEEKTKETAEEITESKESIEMEEKELPVLESNEKTADAAEETAETEETPEPDTVTGAEEPTEEVEQDGTPTPNIDVAALDARLSKFEETLKALAARIGVFEGSEDDESDPFGYAFGAESKTTSNEDELEKAKREAGFNF